jgi:hypothetical protein
MELMPLLGSWPSSNTLFYLRNLNYNIMLVILFVLYCILIVRFVFELYVFVYLCMATLTEVFSCFFLSCKANVRVKPAKTGHGLHSS